VHSGKGLLPDIHVCTGVVLALTVLVAITESPVVSADMDLLNLMPALCRLLHFRCVSAACNVSSAPSVDAPAEHAALTLVARILSCHPSRGSTAGAMHIVQSSVLSSLAEWLDTHFSQESDKNTRTAMEALFQGCMLLEGPLMRQPSTAVPLSAKKADIANGKDELPSVAEDKGAEGGEPDSSSAAREVAAAVCALARLSAADVAYPDLCRGQPSSSQTGQTEDSGKTADATQCEAGSGIVTLSSKRVQEQHVLQWQAMEMVAALLSMLCKGSHSLKLALAPHTLADVALPMATTTAALWRSNLVTAVLRVLTSRGGLPARGLDAALALVSSIVECFGPLALLQLPTVPIPLGKIDARDATKLVSVLALVIKVEVYCHLQALALQIQPSPEVVQVPPRMHGQACSSMAFNTCIDLQASLLDLLMMDSLCDFEATGASDVADPCSRAGLELLAAAVLSDDISELVCACLPTALMVVAAAFLHCQAVG
jgi:hypothetical protein